jgi:hypothetical protein
MNLQTSFLTPPFGFALFYLRSVAAKRDYKDRVTGEMIPAVETTQIYKGSIAFIVLQLIMVAAVIAFPTLVTGGIEKTVQIDADQALEQLQAQPRESSSAPEPTSGDNTNAKEEKEDPMKGLLESMKVEKAKP